MFKTTLFAVAALFFTQLSGSDVISKMHDRYAGKWHKTLTFVQETGYYRNDTLQRTIIWNEALEFPHRLRIDFGDKQLGNSVIYREDSTYNFRNNKRLKATKDHNDLIFLIGGMYFMPKADALATLKKWNYNLDKTMESTWKGKPVYVVGAGAEGEQVNQLWIEKERMLLVRMIKYENGRKMEIHFDGHQKHGTSWVEKDIKFYLNDKLYQTELYKDVKTGVKIDPAIFDPAKYGTATWY